MAKAFKYGSRGITGSLHSAERKLLRDLFADIIHMLEERAELHRLPEGLDPLYALTGMRPADLELPPIGDPALARLLPDASDDPQVAREHRRLTESDLIGEKIDRLREAQFLLETDKIVLDPAGARRFAQALNDVRLVLSERLEIRSEADSERISQINDAKDVTTPEEYLGLVYNLVSWVQDTLMHALMNAEY
ncbi:DUF2017 domain-containing protein [Glutamicibacter protophormiae]|uniref:DUF2017 domain-containing protein n=1 Tax=Glutamicibacter protophormiae TaxID=37930 RepID=A0ABS4XS76_GLUPR|nr:DUF2017 domain-containing protein [Glutamicibacter protophormiae]MBP2399240.1 hypothetical protein [Glutamicibacter protophormiae]GGL91647.1 hypothetical protein GCM10010038_21940 [Glutamicibacter protophormiae]